MEAIIHGKEVGFDGVVRGPLIVSSGASCDPEGPPDILSTACCFHIELLALIFGWPIQDEVDSNILPAPLIKLGDVAVSGLSPLPLKIWSKKVPADESALFKHTLKQPGEIKTHLQPVAVGAEVDARSFRQLMNNSRGRGWESHFYFGL